MNFLKIGKLVNTHGIKGEVKIISDFTKKNLVFILGYNLYLGNKKTPMTITGYRHHKMFDMFTFDGIENINEVLKYKGMDVFINKEDLKLPSGDYLIEDLIGFDVIENNRILGKINYLMYNNGNDLLSVTGENNFYIPIKGNYIKRVILDQKIVEVENAEGLIV